MFKQLLKNIHYWLGSKDFISGHDHYRKCGDEITSYNLDHDNRCVSIFSSKPEHTQAIISLIAIIMEENKENTNG